MPRKATSKVEQSNSVSARPSRSSRKATSYIEKSDSENDQDEDDFEVKKQKPRKTKSLTKLPARDNKRKRETQNEAIEAKKPKKLTKSNKISAIDEDETGSDLESGSENSENKIEKMSSDEEDDNEIAERNSAKSKKSKIFAKTSQKNKIVKRKGKNFIDEKPNKLVKSNKNTESEEETGSNVDSGKENSEDEQRKMSTDEEDENEFFEEKSAKSKNANASASDEDEDDDDENEIINKSAKSKKARGSAKAEKNNETNKNKKGKRNEKVTQSNDNSDTKSAEAVQNSNIPKKDTESDNLDFSNESISPKGDAWNYKISSWNINGVRAWMEKEGLKYLQKEKPDIMCVQETKCSDDKLPAAVKNVQGYYAYWLSGDKDGYSGVGLLSKEEPISVKYGIDISEHDNEGRVITAEYPKFYLVAAYVPNAGRGLVRLEYRMQWDKDFRCYLKKLDEEKPVILCGDLNVAHEEIDLANPKTNKKNAGFTLEEREGFTSLLEEGFVDSFRHLYPDTKGAYTFWTYMKNAREKNIGWRLDYFVISEKLKDNLCDSVIRKDVLGSDHCPVTLFLHI